MDKKLHIHNSGLVILPPYLTRYFSMLDMLDMLDGDSFRSEADAIRGVLLLEYLASGRSSTSRYSRKAMRSVWVKARCW
ncbi:MAG: contractile injection system tape measure protein [Lewinella sp.]